MADLLINGVPADQWGTWCEHGKRVVAPDMDVVYEAVSMLACPYRQGTGICVTGCRTEPACMTGEPSSGGSPSMTGWQVQANYPPGVPVDPWPCDADGCTPERFEKDMAEAEAAYEAERWADYERLVNG